MYRRGAACTATRIVPYVTIHASQTRRLASSLALGVAGLMPRSVPDSTLSEVHSPRPRTLVYPDPQNEYARNSQ